MRATEKVLKHFDTSLEWLSERIELREGEIDKTRHDDQMEERLKIARVRTLIMYGIKDVQEEVELLVDTYYFNRGSEMKSSLFLKRSWRTRIRSI